MKLAVKFNIFCRGALVGSAEYENERFLCQNGQKSIKISVFLNPIGRFKSNKRSHSGDNGGEDPPVPIPRECET